jgi:hypothetical protein
MMEKNCPTYNQIILPIALMSICALFKFKSSNALLDTGDVPQGSNSHRCSAHLRIGVIPVWQVCSKDHIITSKGLQSPP